MTIIAGFSCSDGVLLCADSQETLGSSKRSVPKLHFQPIEPVQGEEAHFSNLAVAFCGAGDGSFIDKLATEGWNACREEKSLSDACDAIEQSIKDTYKEFGRIYQPGHCPEAHLIYGVKMDGKSRSFSAMGPIVNEKFEFESGGVGHYMADFLASKLHCNWLPVRQAAILAAYILLEAKDHVDGCGGDPQIVALRNEGSSGTVSHTMLYDVSRLINISEWNVGRILLESCDIYKSDEEVEEAIKQELYMLDHSRQHTKIQHKMKYETPPSDLLGLPTKEKESEPKNEETTQ